MSEFNAAARFLRQNPGWKCSRSSAYRKGLRCFFELHGDPHKAGGVSVDEQCVYRKRTAANAADIFNALIYNKICEWHIV